MKSIRSTVGVVVALVGAIVLGLALLPSGASAHYWYVYATCDKGLDVQLSWYEGTGNTVDIWIDDQSRVSTTFNASYSTIESFGDLTLAHTYRVKVVELGNAEGTFDTGTQPFAKCLEGGSSSTATTQQGGGGGTSTPTSEATSTTAQGSGGGSSSTSTTQQSSGGGGTSSTQVGSSGGSVGSSGGSSGSLPVTGGDTGMLVAVGTVLLATGVTTTILARRRAA